MSGPRVFPCGTNGYPACPPQDASEIYVPTKSIVAAYHRLTAEDVAAAEQELADEHAGETE